MRTTMPPGFSLAAAVYFMVIGPRGLKGGPAGVKDAHGQSVPENRSIPSHSHSHRRRLLRVRRSRYARRSGDPLVSVCVWTRLGYHGKETVRNRTRREKEDPLVA